MFNETRASIGKTKGSDNVCEVGKNTHWQEKWEVQNKPNDINNIATDRIFNEIYEVVAKSGKWLKKLLCEISEHYSNYKKYGAIRVTG